MRPRVGVIGSGAVGRALASGFVDLGHEVMIGSREPEKLEEWVAAHGERASAGTDAEAASFADLIVFAVRWTAAEEVARIVGADRTAGKVVIDTTNPLVRDDHTPVGLALGWNDSAGEQVQRWFSSARVVKAFNIIGAGDMVEPDYPCGPPTMFICGDDRDAKHAVEEVLREFGWEAYDLGGIEQCRYVEPLAFVWIRVRTLEGRTDHAFKLLRR
jgi:predicted dinucleotide-binding enzyme